MNNRSVLLASNYNVWREPFNGQSQSFLNVVAGVENADVLAPEGAGYLSGFGVRPSVRYLAAEFSHRMASQMRMRVGRPGLSNMIKTEVEKNYDLFFFCCQFPQELAALNRMPGWRKRSGWAACYIMESWSSALGQVRANLRILDQFDHVFVLNAQSIPELKKYTSARISHLPPATDVALATPMPLVPQRWIDVYSYGRRAERVHAQLLGMSSTRQDFNYVYDSIQGGRVPNWQDHRCLTASFMKRARYFIAFNPKDIGGGAKGAFRNEQALSTRYFEGAAGGAVMLGSAPECVEFDQHFDWPDAVIPLDSQGDVHALLAELDAQPDRMAEVSHRNVVETLRRHDWSHRWQQMLAQVGLQASDALKDRHAELRRLSELDYAWR